jgi:hypothetical protein
MKLHHPSVLLVVCILLLAAPGAFAAPDDAPPLPRVRGTVASIVPNHVSFDITDRNGNRMTIQLRKQTRFYINQDEATLADVVVVGDDVQVSLMPDNSAAEVTNRNRARAAAADLRPDLDCTDDEWEALAPLVTNVLQAQRALNGQGRSELRTAIEDLRAALQNPHAMNSDIAYKLHTLRSVEAKTRSDLQKAEQDLTALLTPRQEATLVAAGVLD